MTGRCFVAVLPTLVPARVRSQSMSLIRSRPPVTGSDGRHPSLRSTFPSASRSLMSFVNCCAELLPGSTGCRLAKLTKQHGLPLWENAGAEAAESDAESSGRPVRHRTPLRCLRCCHALPGDCPVAAVPVPLAVVLCRAGRRWGSRQIGGRWQKHWTEGCPQASREARRETRQQSCKASHSKARSARTRAILLVPWTCKSALFF